MTFNSDETGTYGLDDCVYWPTESGGICGGRIMVQSDNDGTTAVCEVHYNRIRTGPPPTPRERVNALYKADKLPAGTLAASRVLLDELLDQLNALDVSVIRARLDEIRVILG